MQVLAIFESVPIPKSWCNFLVASNGATSIDGNSSKLSFYEDRKRMLKIRNLSNVILIGGNTLKNYPYHKLEKTILVSSKNKKSDFKNIKIFNFSPLELLEYASNTYSPAFLIEGGVNFITPLIKAKCLETIFLGRSVYEGDDNFFDEGILKENYHLSETFGFADGALETWHCL